MSRRPVWQVVGRLRPADKPRSHEGTTRTVFVALPAFPTLEQCQEALLANWSRNPHVAEVRAVRPVDGEAFEQLEVSWPEVPA